MRIFLHKNLTHKHFLREHFLHKNFLIYGNQFCAWMETQQQTNGDAIMVRPEANVGQQYK